MLSSVQYYSINIPASSLEIPEIHNIAGKQLVISQQMGRLGGHARIDILWFCLCLTTPGPADDQSWWKLNFDPYHTYHTLLG